MQRLLNNPEDYVDEMLKGIYAAYPDRVKYVEDDMRCYVTTKKTEGKVALMTGGGSGHLPLFLGYVGDGMLDGCAIGGVFQSPSAEQIANVIREIDSGAGVVFVYGNYTGDIMNFEMAEELVDFDDIKCLHVLGTDDVASAPKGQENKRRGVAGIYFVIKCAGAAADAMLPLEEVARVAQKAADHVRTFGVALSPCVIPEKGEANFSVNPGEMELGMGIHGEPGVEVCPVKTADETVDYMLSRILADLETKAGDEVAVLINGLGGTPLEELYIMYNRVAETMKEQGITVYFSKMGELATSMDMIGASISVMKLDDELKKYLSTAADTPFIHQNAIG